MTSPVGNAPGPPSRPCERWATSACWCCSEHEARTRRAPRHHSGVDGASEGKTADRGACRDVREKSSGAGYLQRRSVREDHELAVAPARQAVMQATNAGFDLTRTTFGTS